MTRLVQVAAVREVGQVPSHPRAREVGVRNTFEMVPL